MFFAMLFPKHVPNSAPFTTVNAHVDINRNFPRRKAKSKQLSPLAAKGEVSAQWL